jgi:hypothetical protein
MTLPFDDDNRMNINLSSIDNCLRMLTYLDDNEHDQIHMTSVNDNDDKRSSTVDDLSSMLYTLVDELFLELFYRGVKQDLSESMEHIDYLSTIVSRSTRIIPKIDETFL